MAVLRMLTASELRRRWRSVLALTLLVGFSGAIALALMAGARRTDTALERFEAWSRSAQLEVDAGHVTPRPDRGVSSLAGRRRHGELRQMTLLSPGAAFLPTAAQVDGRFGRDVDRAKIVKGRAADLSKVDELTIGEALAQQLHVRVGDHLDFTSYSPTDIAAQTSVPVSHGPRTSFRIVGIVRRPLDLGSRGASGGVIVPSPAFRSATATPSVATPARSSGQ
jgi:hypothetical protein